MRERDWSFGAGRFNPGTQIGGVGVQLMVTDPNLLG